MKKITNYKAQFTTTEKNIFNMVESEKLRFSAMSVYGVLINSSEENISELTYRQILDKTIRNYKMSTSMLKRRIEKLAELNLIEIVKEELSKVKVKYRYKIIRKLDAIIPVKNEKENEKENEDKLPQLVENTTSNPPIPVQNSESKKDIYNIYIKAFEKDKLIKEAISIFGIKKHMIIKAIKHKLFYKDLNKAGAIQYINKVILETLSFFEQLGKLTNMQAKKVFNKKQKAKKVMKFKNHEERDYTKNEFEDMYDDPSVAFC